MNDRRREEERVLIVAPAGRDAMLLHDALERTGTVALACADVDELIREMQDGVGIVVLTEEALDDRTVAQLRRVHADQPPWSDLPLVLLVSDRPPPQARAALSAAETLGNVTMLDRPVSMIEFLTAIRAGLRTRRRQYEIRGYLAELKANSRAKDQFLAMLGHELRNPLSAVRNAVATASMDEARRGRALAIAERQLQQLGLLIDDLLDVARVTLGRIKLKKDEIVLNEVVERAIESVRPATERRSHTLHVELAAEPIRLDADAGRVEQIVCNLLVNAAKYTDPGGTIHVRTARATSDAEIRVRDNGIGIAPNVLARVFELFTQGERALDRAEGGLGVGLTIARNLAQLHGGDIEAHSDGLGHGSEFVVRLPALAAAAAPTPPAETIHAAGAGPRRVLIVDDNLDVAESLSMILEILGHHVRAAHDGPEALATARANRPDVMLIDIGLPGMNGYDVARAVREEAALGGVVLVALTGYGTDEDRARSFAAGFDYHLVKPVNVEALRDLVGRVGAAPKSPVLQ
jgi:signal transduction histidine kinase/ActR/RegA family two-component response regulator